ncbi:hypothetical protein ACFLYU_00620 [Candidatus Dependentiae bacterium]
MSKTSKLKKVFSIFSFIYLMQTGYVTAKTPDCYCLSRRNSPCCCPLDRCNLRRCNVCNYGKTFFQPRSQNTNTARRAVGHHNFRHTFGKNKFHGSLTVTPEYMQSFKPYHIAEYFFGTDILNFSGSMVTERACNDILADYFGLSPEFESCVRFEPRIRTFLLDFDVMLEFQRGFYIQFYAPLVRTKWQMCMCEKVEEHGLDTPFPAGYMADGVVEPPFSCASKALGGCVGFGDVLEGIKYGKFCCSEQKTTKLADVTCLLGWIFLNRENGYVGVNAQFTAPTGTQVKNKYIFEPIAGNGHHWEFGIGFTGQVLIWEKDDDQTMHFHFDANFSHLFKTCQCRSFDFKCNRFLSRYMLLKQFDADGNYTKLVPAINVTTLKCKVKANFQMDLNIMFAYNNNNWEFDFGYNGWLRSHEEICLVDKIPDRTYAFKGIQNVSNLDADITQSSATIFGNKLEDQAQVADVPSPVFICNDSIDICSAASPKVLTHKFYAHASHAWEKEERSTTPYLGAGWQIEFESVNPRFRCPYKNTLYQWAIWLKCGAAYG